MKMQNEMPAPRAGRVVLLRAAPGAAVAAGELLAAIE
jgi:biotin carboxyl carrier protein